MGSYNAAYCRTECVIFPDPFYWANASYAKEPFCEEIVEELGPKLDSPRFIEEVLEELRALFKVIKKPQGVP